MQIDIEPTSRTSGPDGLRIECLGVDRYREIQDLNETVFGERRVIIRLDRNDLLFLVAYVRDEAVGYKVGYAEDKGTFYSAKGGVLDGYRRLGIARALLLRMQNEARAMGYRRLAFDTFPNMHRGMTILGLTEGYKVATAGYNAAYQDYRLRFEKLL